MSCDYFDKKKVNEQDLLNEELKTVNWNDVDEYPLFETCKSDTSKQERKQCFETNLADITKEALRSINYIVSEEINDTIFMSFQIDHSGKLKVTQVTTSSEVKEQLPQIDSVLTACLENSPKILPALKRGQPVRTEFILPVVINSN